MSAEQRVRKISLELSRQVPSHLDPGETLQLAIGVTDRNPIPDRRAIYPRGVLDLWKVVSVLRKSGLLVLAFTDKRILLFRCKPLRRYKIARLESTFARSTRLSPVAIAPSLCRDDSLGVRIYFSSVFDRDVEKVNGMADA